MLNKTNKEEAKKEYIEARNNYLLTSSKENWIKFCNAKRKCRLLGVIM